MVLEVGGATTTLPLGMSGCETAQTNGGAVGFEDGHRDA